MVKEKTQEITVGDEEFLTRLSQKDNYTPLDVEELPHPFERPSLIITGRQDSITGYHDPMKILENYPRATFSVLDRAGHILMLEQDQLIINLFGEWLDRVEENIK